MDEKYLGGKGRGPRQKFVGGGGKFCCYGTGHHTSVYFPQKFAFFSSFSRWRDKHSFLENCSTNSRFVYRLSSRYSSSTKKSVLHERRLPHNFNLHFPIGKCVTWKNIKNVKYLRQHSIDIHQVFTKIIAMCRFFKFS